MRQSSSCGGRRSRVSAHRAKSPNRQIEEVVTKTLESMPANSTHWSTRLMATEMGLTQNAIVRIRKREQVVAEIQHGREDRGVECIF